MIRVDRSPINPPHVLTDPNSLGAKEIKKALELFNQPPAMQGNLKIKFSAYSHDEVKEALYSLFKGKCAYCEKIGRASCRERV